MTLLKIASGNKFHTVLVDMNIRKTAATDDDQCDALNSLHELLETDDDGRPFVDVLLLTHPDEDHIRGFADSFHQGDPADYSKPKPGEKKEILIREIWSSPMVFKRKSKNHTLCDDAIIFNTEAKRRVNLYRTSGAIGIAGNRIRIIGEDNDNSNEDISEIVYENEAVIDMLNEVKIKELSATVLGPLSDREFDESVDHDKNRSSVIIQWAIASHGYTTASNHILLGGDAGVAVWEVLWDKYSADTAKLQYDILIPPHHCSWRTLSHDSYSESDDPKVSEKAKSALEQALDGAVVVSSSKAIKNDDNDPPNHQAKKEYEGIVDSVDGEFRCLADNKPSKKKAPEVLTYALTNTGPQEDKTSNKSTADNRNALAAASLGSTGRAISHG